MFRYLTLRSIGRSWKMEGMVGLSGRLQLSIYALEAKGNIPFFSQHALKTFRTDFISSKRPISSLNPLPAGSFENGSGSVKRGSTPACEMRSPSG